MNDIFALIFLAVAVFCFGSVVKILLDFSKLMKIGTAALGKIVEVRDDPENTWIIVRYSDKDGITHNIISSIASSGYRNQIGKELEVYYDPTDPAKARIVDDVYSQIAMFIIIGTVFGYISIFLLLK